MNSSRPKRPPDLTSPPKSRYAAIKTAAPQGSHRQPPDKEQAPRPKVSHTPPNFGFKIYPNPTPSPPPAVASTQAVAALRPFSPEAKKKKSPLLIIPLEIRLQIYDHVLRAQKMHHAKLAPLPKDQPRTFSGMNTEEFHTVMLRPRHVSNPGTRKEERRYLVSASEAGSVEEWMVQDRKEVQIQGKIPTGLLACCRQVYNETRRVPFEQNTFIFVNWWWSGIFCAVSFTRSLEPWQASSLRHVQLEALARDLWRERGEIKTGGVDAFIEACGLWSGVRVLKIILKGAVLVDEAKWGVGEGSAITDSSTGADGSADQNKDESQTKSEAEKWRTSNAVLDVNKDWITRGILSLHSLRTLEIAIEDEEVPRSHKLSFCSTLSSLFNSPAQQLIRRRSTDDHDEERAEGSRDIRVVLCEEIEVVLPNREFVWYGGEPGDEMVWGDGS